jgi:hypothetical protein
MCPNATLKVLYFRPRKIFAITGEMLTNPRGIRLLGEGIDFLRFLSARRRREV